MKVPKNISYPFIQQTIFGKIKIYKGGSETSPDYTVSWVSQDLGRQRKVFRDRDKAFLKMEELIDDFSTGKISRKNVTTEKAMQIAEYDELLKPFGATIKDAVNFYITHRAKTDTKQILAAAAAVEYLKQFNTQKGRHFEAAKSNLTKFGRHFLKTLDKITVTELDTYFKSISENGKTRNHHLGYVRTFFKWAQEWGGYLPEGKLEISKIKQYPEKQGRPDLYEPEDLKKLLDNTSQDLIPYMIFGAFAGIRSAEICRLTWKEVHLDQKRIRLGPEITKTKSGRLAIIPDNLLLWLERFTGERKGKVSPHGEKDIHHYTRDIADKAGIPWKQNALRKGYISARMAQPGASVGSVAEDCGNSPEVIKSNYQGLVLPEYAEKWFSIKPIEVEG